MTQREIKFRAWDKNTNVMRYPDGKKGSESNGALVDWFEDEDLMQYTGLKDKNDKEIYEGDVVKRECVEPFSDMHGGYTLQEVTFNNGTFILSYLISEKGIKMPRGYTASFVNDFEDVDAKHMLWSKEPIQIPVEVIGNIYEHPHLLQNAAPKS
jgi:uncharacterized phage protein (TIGR01671 family)